MLLITFAALLASALGCVSACHGGRRFFEAASPKVGLMKAPGCGKAPRWLALFFTEAMLLALMGGVIGFCRWPPCLPAQIGHSIFGSQITIESRALPLSSWAIAGRG